MEASYDAPDLGDDGLGGFFRAQGQLLPAYLEEVGVIAPVALAAQSQIAELGGIPRASRPEPDVSRAQA